MSLYQLSKFLYELNRDDDLKGRFKVNPADCLGGWDLSDEERVAVLESRLAEQDRTIRHTLTMLIEWIETDDGQRAAA